MQISITLPLGNERSPAYVAQALSAIRHANSKRLQLCLILGSRAKTTGLFLRFPPYLRHIVEGQIADAYPDAKITRLPETAFDASKDSVTCVGELRLRPDIFPLKERREFEDILKRTVVDPITGLLSAVKPATNSQSRSRIEITLRPAGRVRCRIAERITKRLIRRFFAGHSFVAIVVARALTSHNFLVRMVAHIISVLLSSRKEK